MFIHTIKHQKHKYLFSTQVHFISFDTPSQASFRKIIQQVITVDTIAYSRPPRILFIPLLV